MIYPIWRQQLVRSLHIHRSKPEAKYFQAASVSNEGLPKLRTMVFRGFLDQSNTLLAITDIRSEKIAEWQASAFSELHWYFVKSREQYRLSCEVTVLCQRQGQAGDTVALGKPIQKDVDANSLYCEQWHGLSQGAKAGFYCPAPKSSLNNVSEEEGSLSHSFETRNEQEAGISQYFALVLFAPTSIDYLDLKTSPHTRVLHAMDEPRWTHNKVNP